MTNEAKDRAIRWLTEEVRLLRLAPKVNGCEPDNWADSLEVMETCLEAVRSCNKVNINREELSCAGCDYLDRENVPCAHCVRAAGYADYYKPMAELEKRLRG